jgi:uncharacterized protein with FMN-binding domain
MRRITYWALTTLSVLVLLFSYRTSTSSSFATGVVAAGTANAGSGSGSSGSTGSADSSGASADGTTADGTTGSSGSASGSGASGSTSTSGSQTYTGDAVSTRFGDVQVQITVSGGKVTKSVVTQVPWNDRRDQEINSYAVPILNEEAVTAQSASIDMVSGATFTSDGYIQSLQSALDQAHL